MHAPPQPPTPHPADPAPPPYPEPRNHPPGDTFTEPQTDPGATCQDGPSPHPPRGMPRTHRSAPAPAAARHEEAPDGRIPSGASPCPGQASSTIRSTAGGAGRLFFVTPRRIWDTRGADRPSSVAIWSPVIVLFSRWKDSCRTPRRAAWNSGTAARAAVAARACSSGSAISRRAVSAVSKAGGGMRSTCRKGTPIPRLRVPLAARRVWRAARSAAVPLVRSGSSVWIRGTRLTVT